MALGKSCSDECLLETVGLDTLEGVEHHEESQFASLAFSVLPVLVAVLWQNIAHAVGFLFQLLI